MKLVSIALSVMLLAGCASYRPPDLPLAATAEERQRSARCEALAAQHARDASTSVRWDHWVPGDPMAVALAPVFWPLLASRVKREREATFAAEYQRCLNWAPVVDRD